MCPYVSLFISSLSAVFPSSCVFAFPSPASLHLNLVLVFVPCIDLYFAFVSALHCCYFLFCQCVCFFGLSRFPGFCIIQLSLAFCSPVLPPVCCLAFGSSHCFPNRNKVDVKETRHYSHTMEAEDKMQRERDGN